MSKIEQAVQWAVDIADHNAHGYDQNKRWGMDYDCSSLVISAFEQAGVPVRQSGASYTGNMYDVFKKCGFIDVTESTILSSGKGMKRGDVLLRPYSHTAIHIGDNRLVHASLNENGKISGGQSGDQTGKEICIRSYYNKPWKYILRYSEGNKNQGQQVSKQLLVDGFWGQKTTLRLQEIFQTKRDGVISNQWKCYQLDNPGLASGWEWHNKPNGQGSQLIREIQKYVRMQACDGEIGPDTIKTIQRYFGTEVDGFFSSMSQCIRELQKWANSKK